MASIDSKPPVSALVRTAVNDLRDALDRLGQAASDVRSAMTALDEAAEQLAGQDGGR